MCNMWGHVQFYLLQDVNVIHYCFSLTVYWYCYFIDCSLLSLIVTLLFSFLDLLYCNVCSTTEPKTNFPMGTIKYIVSYRISSEKCLISCVYVDTNNQNKSLIRIKMLYVNTSFGRFWSDMAHAERIFIPNKTGGLCRLLFWPVSVYSLVLIVSPWLR